MLKSPSLLRSAFAGAALISLIAAGTAPSQAQTTGVTIRAAHDRDHDGQDYEAVVPIVQGWYNGKVALYISTDSSRRDVAHLTHTNFVGKLANAIAANAVDDIYQFTNFKQGNIIPSAPSPTGPDNVDPNYTPLWQLSLVTWTSGQPHVLKSEAEVLQEKAAGHVSIVKTTIVINCPVFYTPTGGLLTGVRIVR